MAIAQAQTAPAESLQSYRVVGVGNRSAKLIQQLLLSDQEHNRAMKSLRSTRIIL